ncbi:hypothetical protein [Virgibacillus profundi]|uniref:hypothetical protein n=1 Tax=Virgibacillus profundi TaxID=2024555 RepID=UPI000C281924|nr:hypothetical protein [Virgibacillus profundi]PXY52387.1 hypothetical protein CIT14_17860 [Virgibacillus profundi]
MSRPLTIERANHPSNWKPNLGRVHRIELELPQIEYSHQIEKISQTINSRDADKSNALPAIFMEKWSTVG